ncbi:AAA family ATPase [Melioribacteraceae bacterium 4301-Me]|uniref:cytidylate kinase-like family protein n=1 Tax=Pyranulibacter aquaticus TaxID=3163344 RepID=UPI003596F922
MKILSAYEKARIYIEQHTQETDPTKKRKGGPIITLSRETGIGASSICQSLVEYLNSHAIEEYSDWAYFDRELIEKIMEDPKLPQHFRNMIDEDKPMKMDSWFSELLGLSPSKLSLIKRISKTIMSLAEIGNLIIVGRGANIITANLKNTFHLRLIAPLDFRIENAMKLYKLDRKKAEAFIKKEDEARRNFIKTYFHKNIEDPFLYHAIINTNLLKSDEIAEMIGHCVIKRFPEYFKTHFSHQFKN